MSRVSRRRPKAERWRVGRVSYYQHHSGWWVYFRDGGKPHRRRVGTSREEAERAASELNAQLSRGTASFLTFAPITVADLRQRFLVYHESVLKSTLGTVRRYRAATQHLEDFVALACPNCKAHALEVDRFAAFLRQREVSPNGHANTARRSLRDKGVRFILEACRSMFGFALRMRHLPPYSANPFSELRLDRIQVTDAKPVFVFDAETELAFFRACDDWSFPIHFALAKTGIRAGELVHLLIEDVDLDGGWLTVRGKPELGWRTKTNNERRVPLVDAVVAVLRRVIGGRPTGPVFVRQRFCSHRPSIQSGRTGLAEELRRRLAEQQSVVGRSLTRAEQAGIARAVWRDAGAIKADAIRTSFMRTMSAIGRPEATCPKSWRHTFATLLQDAGVDPLIRQITLGHKPSQPERGALGMTAVYTHTRPETQRAEIDRATRLWMDSLVFAMSFSQQGG